MSTTIYDKTGNVMGRLSKTKFKIFDKDRELLFDCEDKDSEAILLVKRDKEIIAYDIVTEKKGIAKCHPDDKFDFLIGTQIALERMRGYNGKIVCIDDTYSWSFQKGKIYIVKDGTIYFTNGKPVNLYNQKEYKNIDEINEGNCAKFIEIIED